MENEDPVAPESYKPAEGIKPVCAMKLCGGWESHPIHHNKAMGNYHPFLAPNPAATPVTVEAPGNNPWHLFHRLWTKAVGTDRYIKQEWRDLEAVMVRAKIGQNWATPKPIGDVEAAAKTLYEKGFRYEGPVIFACEFGVTAESAQIETIAAILSPFFAPAPPCSECATLKKVLDLVATDELFIQPADGGGWVFWVNVNDMFYPAADGEGIDLSEIPAVWNAWKEKGWPGVVRWVQEKRGGLELRKSREEKILNIENLRTECATLRKERDEAKAEILRLQKQNEKEECTPCECCASAIAERSRAEAQLSTLRDALKNKLNRALSDAKDLNGYATNDDGGLGMRLLKVAGHTTGMIIRLERELKEIAAPTPEVATVKILRGQRKVSLELEHESETGTHSIGEIAPKE